MFKPTRLFAAAALALGSLVSALPTAAQEVTLKLHHFLPAGSFAQTMFLQPWCDRIAKESANKMKCQIYPSMQLGGTPPQLIDQVKDGIVDIVWTLPGYSAGRYPILEVFELPFMMQNPEGTSKALWEFVQQHDAAEFKDIKALAFHVHGDGVFHVNKRPIQTLADMKGLKLRAPTRQTNKLLAALGATPVAMPVPQVSEALSKGVIDGALVPYEVVPAVKLHELAKYHSETDPAEPALYTSTFVLAMNPAKYNSLSPELKKVIDNTTGVTLSAAAGKAFMAADVEGKKLVGKNPVNVIPKSELDNWKKAGQHITDAWVADVTAKGANGKQLLEQAQALIAKHSAAK